MVMRQQDRSWREKVERNVHRWWEVMERRAAVSADPVNPELVFHELSPRLPDDAMLAADSGSGTNWYARHIRIRGSMRGTLSGALATMGCGVPYALGAKFANPDRPAYALVGDGAMQMNGINGLITIAKYWKEWTDPRLVVLVLNNRDLNQVTWEQRAMAGDPRFPGSQSVPDFPYARYADELGLQGIRVDTPEAIGAAWDRALSADRPVVLEAVTDPNVPPLPPHITLEQARHFASSIWARDADALGFIRQTAKDVAESYLPHKK